VDTKKPAANLIVRWCVVPVGSPTGSDMPRDVLDLMRALYGRIVSHEAQAAQAARKADAFERDGRYGEAELLRVLARNHRIRAMEVRAHIGLIEMGFGPDGD
jgi:hypothetical protein